MAEFQLFWFIFTLLVAIVLTQKVDIRVYVHFLWGC